MRTKPSHRSNRKDPSKFPVPAPSQVEITIRPGGINIESTDILVLNPVADLAPISGLLLDDVVPQVATQVDQFNIEVKLDAGSTVTIGTATLLGTMDGIRNIRGGGLVPGQIVFH